MEFVDIFFDTSEFKKTNKKLGEGAFGQVFVVKNLKDGKQFAAKIINNESLVSPTGQLLLIRESSILQQLDHPSIVKFYGINFHSFDDPQFLKPTILTEYLVNGSLKEILKKEQSGLLDSKWSPTKKYIILLGISDAMRYLHSKSILHRDLKPENILIDDDYYPRVCDFGLSKCFSKSLSKSIQLSMSGNFGTPLYMAPELFDDAETFGPGLDVYSFAIIAYEIVTGQEPFAENGKSISFGKLIKKVLSGERPKLTNLITKPMKNLLSRCWDKDINMRPSFDEIFKELSSDFSYLEEDVDIDEINGYLSYLDEKTKKDQFSINETKKMQNDDSEKAQSNEYLMIKKQKADKKLYFEMFKELIEEKGNISNVYIQPDKKSFLHSACESGNVDLVKYIISLNKIDVTSKTIIVYI